MSARVFKIALLPPLPNLCHSRCWRPAALSMLRSTLKPSPYLRARCALDTSYQVDVPFCSTLNTFFTIAAPPRNAVLPPSKGTSHSLIRSRSCFAATFNEDMAVGMDFFLDEASKAGTLWQEQYRWCSFSKQASCKQAGSR